MRFDECIQAEDCIQIRCEEEHERECDEKPPPTGNGPTLCAQGNARSTTAIVSPLATTAYIATIT